jgi:tRNA threonylcarbamoyladenosine biosynthesis protein TsaB
MSVVLGIDTALGQSSVALCRDGVMLAGHIEPNRENQAAHLLDWVAQCLRDAGLDYAALDGIAVATGPGGFTGIRVGLAAARAIGFAAKKPVVGFSTLQLMARHCEERSDAAIQLGKHIHAILPAGRGMVFSQFFEHGLPVGEAQMVPQQHIVLAQDIHIISTIEGLAPEVTTALHDVSRNAELLCCLAEKFGFNPAEHPPIPLYIRPPDAKPQAKLLG